MCRPLTPPRHIQLSATIIAEISSRKREVKGLNLLSLAAFIHVIPSGIRRTSKILPGNEEGQPFGWPSDLNLPMRLFSLRAGSPGIEAHTQAETQTKHDVIRHPDGCIGSSEG